jgi:galactose mutarotase-like enzyme
MIPILEFAFGCTCAELRTRGQFRKFVVNFQERIEMKSLIRNLYLLLLAGGSFAVLSHAQTVTEIGGQKVVTLTRAASSTAKPEFTSVTVLPGRGMEILQITANFPGKGNVDVLASPDLAGSKKMLDVDDDDFGDLGYRLGAALLVPYPNRIRGKLSADGKTVATEWQSRPIVLPANNIGHNPGAERHAMHGLILKAKTEEVSVDPVPGGQEVSGVIHAGDFGGHWPSKTQLVVTVRLTAGAVDVTVVARNVGSEDEPMAIAWHPYFNLPSGNRAQARLRVPASSVAEVDNYDNVFPTGKILPVAGTRFDLRSPGGTPLGDNFFDDNWSHLEWTNHAAVVQIVDPAARYGVSVEARSPEINAIQVYAPPTKNFVAVEHQYNFADPFGKEWGSTDTGMVTLKPGQSTTWHVRLHVFVP